MSEHIQSAVVAHGYGMHPDFDRLVQTMQEVASENNIRLQVPGLSEWHGDTLVMLPVHDQAQLVEDALAVGADRLITISQGGFAAGAAHNPMMDYSDSGRDVVAIVPPLERVWARLAEELDDPMSAHWRLVPHYGGVYGAKPFSLGPGTQRYFAVPEGYRLDVEHPQFQPLNLITCLLSSYGIARVIWAGKDRRIGQQRDERLRLEAAVPWASHQMVPDADHRFPKYERAVAEAALLGTELLPGYVEHLAGAGVVN